MELSEEQRAKILEWFDSKWPIPNICPVCNSEQWGILDRVFRFPEFNPPIHRLEMNVPVILLVCQICGYILFFSAEAVGIIEEMLPHEQVKIESNKG